MPAKVDRLVDVTHAARVCEFDEPVTLAQNGSGFQQRAVRWRHAVAGRRVGQFFICRAAG